MVCISGFTFTFGRGGFTGYFPAERRELPCLSPNTRQSASKKQKLLGLTFISFKLCISFYKKKLDSPLATNFNEHVYRYTMPFAHLLDRQDVWVIQPECVVLVISDAFGEFT